MTTRKPTPAVDDETRARILEMIDSGEMSRNRIAKELGLGASVISRIANNPGREFNTSNTELAIAARRVNSKKALTDIADMMLVRARQALEDMDAPATMVHYDPGNEGRRGRFVEHTLDQPTFADRRNLMVIAGVAVQRAQGILSTTTSGDVNEGVSLVAKLGQSLVEYAQQHGSAPADGEVDPTDPTVLP